MKLPHILQTLFIQYKYKISNLQIIENMHILCDIFDEIANFLKNNLPLKQRF